MSQIDQSSIHAIWDRLAAYPEPELSTNGLSFLLESLSKLIGADHGYWLSGFQMQHLDARKDPALGWRPGSIFFYREMPDDRLFVKNGIKNLEAGILDESTRNHVQKAGHFRATLMRDHVSPGFFDSPHYRHHYQSRNITDTLFVVAPVNLHTEVYFCFNRIGRQTPFGKTELAIAADTLRSLGWFHKKVMLGHGLLIAQKPLTPTEKNVMQQLLSDLTEKQIAQKLNQKIDTTHKHICNIYRKFNINSRAGLVAIWLGHSA